MTVKERQEKKILCLINEQFNQEHRKCKSCGLYFNIWNNQETLNHIHNHFLSYNAKPSSFCIRCDQPETFKMTIVKVLRDGRHPISRTKMSFQSLYHSIRSVYPDFYLVKCNTFMQNKTLTIPSNTIIQIYDENDILTFPKRVEDGD